VPKALSRIRLAQLVSPNEVVTSSELADRLRQREGVTPAYARQLLKRLHGGDGLWRSERLKLRQNERLFAHPQFVGTAKFFGRCAALLENSRPGVARCLRRLAEGLVVHRGRAVKLLAAPVEAAAPARRPAFEEEQLALAELGVSTHRPSTDFECLVSTASVLGDRLDALANQARLELQAELLLARILGDSLRRANLVSWGRLRVAAPDKGYVPFNNQAFTAFGFSYLDPVAEWRSEGKPTGCPVLVDVLTGRCSPADVASFRDRLGKATHRGAGRQKSLGVIAAKDFEPEALREARRRGYLTINFTQTYGKEALEALEAVTRLLNLAGDPVEQARAGVPGFAALLGELKANPVVVTIRSIAFEVIAGLVLQEREGCHDIRMGIDVPFSDRARGFETTRDVDVHGNRGDLLWAVECKAYHSAKEVDFSEVRRFYEEVVPAFLRWYGQSRGKYRECQAEFWTTGRFPPDAQAKLNELHAGLRYPCKVNARLLDGGQVQANLPYALSARCVELLTAIATHESPAEQD
jgi:hypothetical protein